MGSGNTGRGLLILAVLVWGVAAALLGLLVRELMGGVRRRPRGAAGRTDDVR